MISIHALREEGDGIPVPTLQGIPYFYPRPPRGGRLEADIEALEAALFLSTPSARRATAHRGRSVRPGIRISIHALREEGDARGPSRRGCRSISIHALREEGDVQRQPRRPDGGVISIHALREEGDCCLTALPSWPAYFYPRPPRGGRRATAPAHSRRPYFYPRPPRGGRPSLSSGTISAFRFLSTPSARRATAARHAPSV